MIPLNASITMREKACLNCNGIMTHQGVKNGLYIYLCKDCNCSFEIYEPK